MLNNFDLLYSLFNPYVFQEAKNNISSLEYYFQTNPSTSLNPLVNELVNAVKSYDYAVIGEPLFHAIFSKCGKTKEESDKVMQEINKWSKFNKEQVTPAIKYLQDVCSSVIIQKASKLYSEAPTEFIKYLKNYNMPIFDTTVFNSLKFSEVDINSVIEDCSKGAVTTNIEWLNKAFAPHNGIERGQLGIICSPPGTGKSLLSMSLALWMASRGEKVVYYCLGDMNIRDFIVRMGSIALGCSFADSYRNLRKVYDELCRMVGSNLEISINPAGVVTAEEIVEHTLEGKFTVAIVDYDGNLAGVQDTESMYHNFGNIYNTLTKLNLENVLTIVCSQPKVYSWDKEIELSDIGESSRKQHAADWILTMSNPNVECPNHLYTQKLPKARRGKVGAKAYVIRVEGRFKEIPKGLYDQLREVREEKNYTEAEIDTMIAKYNSTVRQIEMDMNRAVNNVVGGMNNNNPGIVDMSNRPGPKNNLKNPFTN